MTDKRRALVFAVLAAAMICIIWSFSLQTKAASSAASSGLLALLRPILDPHGRLPPETLRLWIRKTAHFVEFAALGLCLGGFSAHLGRWKQRRYTAFPLLLALLAAVSDEFLQLFSGRGSIVTDVVLDYAGALFGLGVAGLLARIAARIRERKGTTGEGT